MISSHNIYIYSLCYATTTYSIVPNEHCHSNILIYDQHGQRRCFRVPPSEPNYTISCPKATKMNELARRHEAFNNSTFVSPVKFAGGKYLLKYSQSCLLHWILHPVRFKPKEMYRHTCMFLYIAIAFFQGHEIRLYYATTS